MKNKTLIIIIIIIAVLLFGSVIVANLGIIDKAATYEEAEKEVEQISSVEDMENGKLYIWKDCKGKKISSSKNTFQECPAEEANFKRDNNNSSSANYTVWVDSSLDYEIPTLTSADKLLFLSSSAPPDTYDFLRLYDNGYSFGITSLQKDKSNHYYISYSGIKKNEYKDYINLDSDAEDLKDFDIERLYLDEVGGEKLTDKYVSKNGIITGLKKDKRYKCVFYTGTYYQDYILTANQHTFTEFEEFECHDFDYMHSNCISIKIPEWLCTGYYYVNGIGMFRYVDDNDIANYNGEPYDKNIEWNKPLIVYDERGEVVFDPSIEKEEEVEEKPTGDENTTDAMLQEMSEEDSAEWSREIPEGKKFTAEVTVTRIVNSEPAIITVIAPDGSVDEYTEKDGRFEIEIFEPQAGAYTFTIEHISGRTFEVKYSDGTTYSGSDNNVNVQGDPGIGEEN